MSEIDYANFRLSEPVHYDDGVRFGTASEMIAEIKRLRARIDELNTEIAEHRCAHSAISDYQANGGVTLDELKEEIGDVADPKPFMCMAYDVGPHSGISHHPDCNGECGVSAHHGSEGEK